MLTFTFPSLPSDNLQRPASFRGDDKFDIIITCKDPKGVCKAGREGKRVGGYGWTYTGWFGYKYHYIALCDPFFNLDTLKDRVSLVERALREEQPEWAQQSVYQKNQGLYFLHEMMHLDAVGIPHGMNFSDPPTLPLHSSPTGHLRGLGSRRYNLWNADVWKVTDEKVSSEVPKTAYGPDLVHKLARGRRVEKGGVETASTNADSYAWLANSLYFYEMTNYFPKPPGYRGASVSAEELDNLPPVGLHLGTIDEHVIDEELHSRFADALGGVEKADPEATPPNSDDLPEPECATEGTTFAVPDIEDRLYEMCSESRGLWDMVITPPISIGTGETSDGKTKGIGASQGWDLGGGADEKIWAGVMFSRETCQGYFELGSGKGSEEKVDYCFARLSAVLHGCQTDTQTAKMGGELKEVCAVYAIHVGKDNPFEHSRWYADEGDLECEDTRDADGEEIPGLEDSCTCWFGGYPGLTDVFRKTGDSCDAGEVNLAELVLD